MTAETVVVKDDDEPVTQSLNGAAADEAERAAAAAGAASDAAAHAAALAAVEAANVQQQAADRMAAYEAELGQWRGLKDTHEARMAACENRQAAIDQSLTSLREAMDKITLTLSPQPPQPDSPTNPPIAPSAAGRREMEPPKPERKRAHRWM
jgi:hypothetical protein